MVDALAVVVVLGAVALQPRDVAVDLLAAELGALGGGLLVRERAFALLAIVAEIDYISHVQTLSDIATTTDLIDGSLPDG